MVQLEIRPYRPSDKGRLGAIHDAARKAELCLAGLEDAFLPFSQAAEREDFFQYPHIEVAVADGQVQGVIAYTDEEIAWLYVAPWMARRGIGRALIRRALESEPGIGAIEVLWGNEPAKKLYESFGFYVREVEEGVMPGNETFHVRVWCMSR